jgi:predicted nucleic acid-binding protein
VTPGNGDYVVAATIKATARKKGMTVEVPDCFIASVAVRLGLPIVTGNTEDFQAIQKAGINLIVENWRLA